MTSFPVTATPTAKQPPELVLWVDPAAQTPFEEFGNVHPPLADFGLMDPGLTALKPLSEVALCELRAFSHRAKKPWDSPVAQGVLAFCHCRSVGRRLFDSDSLSNV